jgi:hypothetical protein
MSPTTSSIVTEPLLERARTRPHRLAIVIFPFETLTSMLVPRGTRSSRFAWPRRFHLRGTSTSSPSASPFMP